MELNTTNNVMMYLGFISAAAFLLFGFDKYCSKTGRWRIPENTLLGIAIFGGSLGAYIGMYVFHHKTRKNKFTKGIPLIIAMQAALLLTIMK